MILSRDDLEGDAVRVYDATLRKISDPGPEQVRMVAAYALAAAELKKAGDDQALARHLRRCMVYARNRLGPWKPVPIDLLELLLEQLHEWPPVVLALDGSWQLPGMEDF